MTGARLGRNPRLPAATAVLVVLCSAGVPVRAENAVPDLAPRPAEVVKVPVAPAPPVAAPAPKPAIPERVTTDRHSGIALGGYDPVAYFEGLPVQGDGAYQFTYAGAVWQFRSAGNKAAFAANPEVYAPRFGGYDPVGVTRGVGLPGHPSLWRIYEKRLYVFYTPADMTAFNADPEAVIRDAEQAWPKVVTSIVQ